MSSLSHIATAKIGVSPDAAFEFLTDPIQLGRWSLGCLNTEQSSIPNVYKGRSLFDGSAAFFEIKSNRSSWGIVYHVGNEEKRIPRIAAQVIPPEVCGLPEHQCLVSLIAWRTATMTVERWDRLCATHETEILLIRDQCETAVGASMR